MTMRKSRHDFSRKGGTEIFTVELEIDVDATALELAAYAIKNKSGKSTALSRAVICTVVKTGMKKPVRGGPDGQ